MPKRNILIKRDHLDIAEKVIESDKRMNAFYQAEKRVYKLERLTATFIAALILVAIIAFVL